MSAVDPLERKRKSLSVINRFKGRRMEKQEKRKPASNGESSAFAMRPG